MVKHLVAKVAGVMITAILSATSYTLDITQIINLGWKWWPLVFLAIFFGLVVWIFIDLYAQNSKLLNARPSIDVEVVKEDYTYYLKVHNKGEKGVFKAQFELTSKEPSVWQLPYYNGHWRLANKSEAEIMKGHSDMIKVAESVISTKGSSIELHIFFHDESTKSERYISTSSYWIGAYIVEENGSKRPMTKWDYQLHLSISSSPSLREGIYNNQYGLNVDGLEVDTKAQSTSNKEDFQLE